ncbi:unnamed protein product [Bemisia tabaci]|uniref:Fibronectin type-III domain-containing protein n=1 Tax=Bemisia tabaci TaxID=7038 RepID=A0A9P0F2T9_BEMTA|nr:unnamed protein product [Bemisia tabaci]
MMHLNVLRALYRWHNALALMLCINQATLCQEMELESSQDTDEGCPSFQLNSVCPCYPFEEGLHIECPYVDILTVQNVISKINRTIYSFTIYDLDKSVDVLSKELFVQPNLTSKTVVLKKLYITLSHIRDVDDSFVDLFQKHLKEINIVTSRLSAVPKEINRLLNLNQINFESNSVTEISDHAFTNLRFLQTIILKDNLVSKLSENAFYGLENCLLHLDLSENKLNAFPILPLRRLETLSILKLSFNEIANIIDKTLDLETFKLISLKQLDLSSNNIKFLGKDEFRYFIKLQVLSIYQNLLESIHGEAFKSLTELTSLDLSHNNIIYLDSDLFKYNKKIKVIDLSSNHLYNLDRIFSNLTNLQELYLSDNNILEIGDETFTSCSSLSVLNLEMNSIQEIHEDSLKNLQNLTQIYLQNNHIKSIKRNLFTNSINLDTLSLNDNLINHIDLHAFQNCDDLRELRLNNNKLKQIKKGHFENLPNLVELYLHNNSIDGIERGSFGTLEKLQHINLQNNNLKKFENVFSSPASGEFTLMTLQLNSNSISSLKNNSFNSLVHLKSLYLTDNNLNEISENIFRSLERLEQLFLIDDQVREIHSGAFRHLKMLVLLNASENQLTQLKKAVFKNLFNLEELYLSKNRISTIEPHCFEDLTRLKILDLSNNPLHVIQSNTFVFMNLVHLHLRNCSINSFENDSVVGLEKLEELNLEINVFPAETLKTFKLPNLKELKLSHNSFPDIPESAFSNFRHLQTLYLKDCKISSISEKALRSSNLLKLHLDKNQLRDLPDRVFRDVPSLKELYLNDNLFKGIPEKAFEGLKNLETLEISNNSLKYFSFSQIQFLSKLHKISLQQNLIHEVHVTPNRSNLSFLFEINLGSNTLNSLPFNFFNSLNGTVRILNLSFNRFANLSNLQLDAAINLKLLNLTGNPIQQIGDTTPAGKARNFKESCDGDASKEYSLMIEELTLQRTNLSIITSSDFCSYLNLLHLSLSRNKIQRISPGAFKNLARLLSLDLGYNRIDFIPKERFYGLADLKLLNATQNLISRLDEFPKNLKSLETLDLSYNKIEKISEGAFNNLDNLNELYLYGNWISAISPDAFSPPKKLKLLDISRNNLQNLPLNAIEPLESQIRSLKIEENPLHCGCETQRLWEWLREHKKISEAKNLRCSEPPELKGQALMEVSPPRLCQAPAVRKLTVNDVRPKSVLITWTSSPHTKVYGYRVTYQSVHSADIGKILDQNTRSSRLTNLKSNTKYTICVYGLNSWEAETVLGSNSFFKAGKLSSGPESETESVSQEGNGNWTELQSMCTEATTGVDEDNDVLAMDSNRYKEGSILTRRLGLIIGSCMGFLVFIILISVLGYLKIKKQRATAKRDPPLPPEYLSYRHFSIQGAEHLQASISQGTTTLN